MGCCQAVSSKAPWDGTLKWPARYLFRYVSEDLAIDKYGEETVNGWKETGLDDFVADEVAVWFGTTANNVFPGWTQAGTDFYSEVNDHE